MTQGAKFNPHEHLMQIKNKGGASDYLPVQWRLVWFREVCPDGTIETEIVHLDIDKEMDDEAWAWNTEKKKNEKVLKTAKGVAIVRATVKDGKGGIATGTKMEKAVSFPDFLEKAETGAIGRALAALGYGTQFAPELSEGDRIVDSPVEAETPRLPAPKVSQNSHAVERIAGHQSDIKNVVAPSQHVTEASGNGTDLKARVTAAYRRAGRLNLFESVPNDLVATQANFYKLVSELVGATITASGQITASRLEIVEAYVNSKDSPVSVGA